LKDVITGFDDGGIQQEPEDVATSLFPLPSDLIASLVLVKGVIAAHKLVEVINAVRLVG